MTFCVTRIKRKSKGSVSSKLWPLHFVLDGKRRRPLPVVGSGVLTDENTLPETPQNFFFVFFSFILATFCVRERESVAMLARFEVKGDTKATHLFYQNLFCFFSPKTHNVLKTNLHNSS